MMDFLKMGGYSSFIWSSYGITFATLIWLFIASWQRARNAIKDLQDVKTPKNND